MSISGTYCGQMKRPTFTIAPKTVKSRADKLIYPTLLRGHADTVTGREGGRVCVGGAKHCSHNFWGFRRRIQDRAVERRLKLVSEFYLLGMEVGPKVHETARSKQRNSFVIAVGVTYPNYLCKLTNHPSVHGTGYAFQLNRTCRENTIISAPVNHETCDVVAKRVAKFFYSFLVPLTGEVRRRERVLIPIRSEVDISSTGY
jgi:hypothetical protein